MDKKSIFPLAVTSVVMVFITGLVLLAIRYVDAGLRKLRHLDVSTP